MRKTTLALLVALTLPQMAMAEAFAVSGVGAVSCGKYLDIRGGGPDEVTDAIMGAWFQGFLSGANITRAAASATSNGMTRLPDSHSILAYADKYCRNSPLGSVLGAAVLLDQDLMDRR